MYYNNRPCSTRNCRLATQLARRILAICIVFRDRKEGRTVGGWPNLENLKKITDCPDGTLRDEPFERSAFPHSGRDLFASGIYTNRVPASDRRMDRSLASPSADVKWDGGGAGDGSDS